MLALYLGTSPSIVDPATGKTLVVFAATAAGWSKAVALVRGLR
jgi:hypothetical protein